MKLIDDIKVIMGQKPLTEQTKVNEPPKTILITEDDQILREMYSDKLIKEGFTVITAKDGQEGLEKAISHKPNLILLDLMMPVMDGKTMLRKLREIPEFKKLRVIVLTNAGEVDNIRETQRYDDAVDFLIKSNVTIEDIVKKVTFWIRNN